MNKHLLLAAAALIVSAPASAEVVSGSGSATITTDTESVRVAAEREAKRGLVREMIRQSIGAARMKEVPQQTIDALAAQIRPDMITNHGAHREGSLYFVDLQADIDGAWFRQQLDLNDIDSASDRANSGQLIFVMLDQVNGVASDYSQPAETTVEYDHRTGGSFSDHSAEATSERDASASSSKSAAGYSARSAGAYGVSTPYGSAAGKYKDAGAAGYAAKNSSASAHKYDHASKTNVQAEVHDDVRFREHVVYQRPPANSPGGFALSALAEHVTDYDVKLADPSDALVSFFGKAPRFADLQQNKRFHPFLAELASKRNAPFFMGAELSVTNGARDPATGLATCSGALFARAFATGDSEMIASGTANADATGSSAQSCADNVAQTVARNAAAIIGPKVQKYWRDALKQQAGVNTQELAQYSLVLRGAKLTMEMQSDILDALQSTSGVQNQSFVSQAGNEMRFVVSYAGALPLQLALYQKLRSHPGFAGMQSTVNGRSVLLCLSGCK